MSSAVEVQLARKLFLDHRVDEALEHLAEARRISLYEGDSAATVSVTQAIDSIWSQLHGG